MQVYSLKSHLLNNLQTLPLRHIKEEVTLSKIIDPIIELAGFATINVNSVEEEFDSQTGNSINPIEIDRCLKNNGELVVFIQCKQVGLKHRLKNDHEKTFKAGRIMQIPFIIFTDGLYWEIYKLSELGYQADKSINLLYDSSQYKKVVDILRNMKEGKNGQY